MVGNSSLHISGRGIGLYASDFNWLNVYLSSFSKVLLDSTLCVGGICDLVLANSFTND
jgi:hypothetical protein